MQPRRIIPQSGQIGRGRKPIAAGFEHPGGRQAWSRDNQRAAVTIDEPGGAAVLGRSGVAIGDRFGGGQAGPVAVNNPGLGGAFPIVIVLTALTTLVGGGISEATDVKLGCALCKAANVTEILRRERRLRIAALLPFWIDG